MPPKKPSVEKTATEKKQRRPRLPKRKPELVVAAIKGSGGIKQTIADRLGVHRHTVDSYLERYPEAAQAMKNETEAQGDYAETVVLSAIHETTQVTTVDPKTQEPKVASKPTEKAVDTAKWYLSKKHRGRGYGDTIVIDPTALTLEQLERIQAGEDPAQVIANPTAPPMKG